VHAPIAAGEVGHDVQTAAGLHGQRSPGSAVEHGDEHPERLLAHEQSHRITTVMERVRDELAHDEEDVVRPFGPRRGEGRTDRETDAAQRVVRTFDDEQVRT
jgi:hypothetical protein